MKSTLVMGAIALTLCSSSADMTQLLFSRYDRRHQPHQNSFRILPIKVIFHFKIRSLVTLKFKIALTENKERKHLRGSGETAK